MSVDERIREGLVRANAGLPEPDTIRGLDAVISHARTTTRRRRRVRVSLAAVAAAATAVGVIAVVNGTGADETFGPADRTSQSPEPTVQPPRATPLMVGTYLSDPVSFADIADKVSSQAGGRHWVEPLRKKLGMVDGRRIKLVLDDQTVTATIPGTSFEYTRPYRLEGNSIVIDFPSEPEGWSWWAHYSKHDASGAAGQRPTVSFQEWFSHGTGCPCAGGIAYNFLAMALYGTATFTYVSG